MKQSQSEFWCGAEYDAQYGERYEQERAFLNSLVVQHRFRTGLDVCCGTGLLAIEMSNWLDQVVGIDISQPMLDYAKKKSFDVEHIQFVRGDATSFTLDADFDLVVMTGNAFQAFLTDEDFGAMLQSVSRHMHAKSLFVFDTRLSGLSCTNTANYRDSYFTPMGEKVCINGVQRVHESIENTVIFDIQRDYQLGKTRRTTIELRYRSVAEIERSLAAAGLELVMLYSDWSKSDFCDKSHTVVGIVKKKES
ncbi:methyltransferase domain-containing protein [Vibrio sp. 10N]|uniref:methyltransferase domain-containing protein n=1 Tax=Vibrio sp. 10N TaxID=3058938 RepID=UPI0028134B42|nr:class I SAM-dependent methyltransferase [Vibrio sp. 10N]